MNKIDDLVYDRMFGTRKLEDDVIKDGIKEAKRIRKKVKKSFEFMN